MPLLRPSMRRRPPTYSVHVCSSANLSHNWYRGTFNCGWHDHLSDAIASEKHSGAGTQQDHKNQSATSRPRTPPRLPSLKCFSLPILERSLHVPSHARVCLVLAAWTCSPLCSIPESCFSSPKSCSRGANEQCGHFTIDCLYNAAFEPHHRARPTAIHCGRYPAKREVGDSLRASADIFKDGHDKIAAYLQIRHVADPEWTRSRNEPGR